ncbi:MAG: DUF1016 N-terminal domain-containing protein [Lentimicrobiaceae bacterium]|nr:DUF1016 N-terminal domain-containing protein [Lentimicrobiaceae bacterium]
MKNITTNYSIAIQAIKDAILKSRYRAAALANRELLSLYYGIGKYISENSRTGFWGTGAIDAISERLQQELPGLRGFSAGNIKKMRIFFEQWCEHIENRALPTHNFESSVNQYIENRTVQSYEIHVNLLTEFCPLPTSEVKLVDLQFFLSIGFTHHYEILKKAKTLEEHLFYIERCATEFWSVENLKYHLNSSLFFKQGKLPNNFQTAIPNKDLQRKALLSFKDEYLLDFVNIESTDDEHVLESEIVNNIKKFIMSNTKMYCPMWNC